MLLEVKRCADRGSVVVTMHQNRLRRVVASGEADSLSPSARYSARTTQHFAPVGDIKQEIRCAFRKFNSVMPIMREIQER